MRGKHSLSSYSVDSSLINSKEKGAHLIGKPPNKVEIDPTPGPGTYYQAINAINNKGIK
jgi:hypothetical protein